MRFLIVAAALAAGPAFGEDVMRASNGKDSVTLYETPCVNLAVLARITPRYHPEMRKASAVVGGESFNACWTEDGDSAHLMYEDGDQGLIPMTDFKADRGV